MRIDLGYSQLERLDATVLQAMPKLVEFDGGISIHLRDYNVFNEVELDRLRTVSFVGVGHCTVLDPEIYPDVDNVCVQRDYVLTKPLALQDELFTWASFREQYMYIADDDTIRIIPDGFAVNNEGGPIKMFENALVWHPLSYRGLLDEEYLLPDDEFNRLFTVGGVLNIDVIRELRVIPEDSVFSNSCPPTQKSNSSFPEWLLQHHLRSVSDTYTTEC